MPPEGQNVIVVLEDGTELLAYYSDGFWRAGQDNSPEDTIVDSIISWRFAE